MRTFFVSAALLAATVLLAGCQTSRESRLREHAALVATLPEATRKLIDQGLFDLGFSREMTYISLGRPNRATSTETENGTVEVWKYQNFLYNSIGAMQLSANTPGSKPYGPILGSNAPGGPSLFSTKAGPMQATLSDSSDAPVGTLYIEFLNGRIVAARIDP